MLKTLLGLLIVLSSSFYGVYLRFSNPDMTSTRLLLTFWKYYIFLAICCGIGMLLMHKGEK